jgi:hypothetical protein
MKTNKKDKRFTLQIEPDRKARFVKAVETEGIADPRRRTRGCLYRELVTEDDARRYFAITC